MRSALAELTAALLLTGTASGPQRADGAPVDQVVGTDQTTVAAPAQTEPVTPRPRSLRDQLLDELRAAIARPREAVAPASPPAPVEPPATSAGTPPPAPSVTTAPAAPVKPRVAVAPVKPTPRAANPLPPPVDVRPTAPAAPPAVALTVPPAPPAPPGPLVPTASFERPPSTIQPAPLAAPANTSSPWPLLTLLAALVAATAAAYHWRRRAQIARTRAALNLDPKVDLTAGACSTTGLSFAAPPMSIQARLAYD